MGNMAVAIKRRQVVGNRKRVSADLTFSASYATNGDTLVAADIQALLEQKAGQEDLTIVDIFIAEVVNADGTELSIDRTNKKIKAWNGRAEVANATNLSGATARCIFEYGDQPSKNV